MLTRKYLKAFDLNLPYVIVGETVDGESVDGDSVVGESVVGEPVVVVGVSVAADEIDDTWTFDAPDSDADLTRKKHT